MHDTGTTIAVFIGVFSAAFLYYKTREAIRKDKFLRRIMFALLAMNTFTLVSWLITL